MTGQLGGGAGDAGTVSVRVQVVDVESAALDLVVPTYLPAKDVTQRIARDANLGAYWPDGQRRLFWIRARGRLLGEDERLQDLGVINGELIHILPQPPDGAQVIERPPEYPVNTGYRGGSIVVTLGSVLTALLFTALWALALTVVSDPLQGLVVGLVPGLAVALLSVSASRHFFGPPGSALKIPAVGLVLFVPLFVLAIGPAFALGGDTTALAVASATGFFGGLTGLIMGWLAWYGAVEPLPEGAGDAAKAAVATVEHATADCAICGAAVALNDLENRQDCVYQCGRVFHAGCYRARASIAREGQCAVCGYQPGAA